MKRTLSFAITLLAVAFGSVIATPSAALAHDEIIGTSPAADASVAPAAQLMVSVTFNEPAMKMGNNEGIEIQVTAPDGSKNVLPCLTVDGPKIWAVANAAAEGTYVVDWRSVSNDGHANSGTFNFSVAAGAPAGESSPSLADCMAAGDSAKSAADPSASASGAASSNSSGSKLDPIFGLVIGIGLLVVLSLLGAIAAEVQKRRRASKEATKKLKAEIEANPDMLRGL